MGSIDWRREELPLPVAPTQTCSGTCPPFSRSCNTLTRRKWESVSYCQTLIRKLWRPFSSVRHFFINFFSGLMSTIKLTLTSAHRLLPAGCDQWLTNLSAGHCWAENMAVRDEWLAVLDSTRSACVIYLSPPPLSHDLHMRRCRITSSHPLVTFSITSLLHHHPHPSVLVFFLQFGLQKSRNNDFISIRRFRKS